MRSSDRLRLRDLANLGRAASSIEYLAAGRRRNSRYAFPYSAFQGYDAPFRKRFGPFNRGHHSFSGGSIRRNALVALSVRDDVRDGLVGIGKCRSCYRRRFGI